ncbi:hypothetical protein LINGRAHAP2_LOCUS23328 [Linum grandiflorum]
METKQQREFMEEKHLSFNFAKCHYVDPVGTSGGLALWWMNGLSITIIESTKKYIHVFISYGAGFYCTFVYAPSTQLERREFWPLLNDLQGINQLWIQMGDFNSVAFSHEKRGGIIPSATSLQPFRTMIEEHGLLDKGFSGSPFTWTNRQQRQDHIRSRLDIVLVNTHWNTQYDNV